ncbi:MAG: response regulator, partial [Bacillota bacterium]
FESAGDNLLTLINDILDLSKIEAGKIELEEKEFNLVNTVESIAEMMAIKAYNKELELPCRISPIIPEYLIGDQGRLKQILINIIGNAIKFTKEGEVSIQVDLFNKLEKQNKVKIMFEVTDTGIGIPKERQEEIFASFTQADSSNTREYGGTGLGLAISKELVELMEGEIWLESNLGDGSSFYFTVSLSVSEQKALGQEETDYQLDYQELDVLIVDDNSTNLLILEEYLAFKGASVDLAEGAEEAIALLENDMNYQLILLDFLMPQMNGIKLAKYIRTELNLTEVKIIILFSDFQSRPEEKDGFAYIDDYLMKPLRKKDLFSCIARVMNDSLTKEQNALVPEQTTTENFVDVEQSSGKKTKILLVEDVEDNRMLINAYLKKLNYDLEIAVNGVQALEKFKDNNYQLVLMDIQMPIMDGYEATKKIRKLEKEQNLSSTPIIALTAYALDKDIEKILANGFNQHLAKPIKKDNLLNTIQNYS